MGLLDKVTDFVRSKIPDMPVLNVCMMGPRSVGKTTVLTSIFFETQDSICGTRLYLNAIDANTAGLTQYYNELKDAVPKGNASNLPASNCDKNFNFGLGLKGQKPSLCLNVKDFPGEYLITKPSEVNRYMAEATVVLIAIDTPYLMEEGGKFNIQKNKVDVVTAFLRNNPNEIKDKLVLFVPLKCEFYAHNGRIEEVSEKVRETYADLVAFFKRNNIASFITPIHTLGGMEFDRMTDNSRGMGDVEKIAEYRLYSKMPKYAPLFCPQPLYYLLTYVVNFYEWRKKHPEGGFVLRIKDMISSVLMRDSSFYAEIQKLRRYILCNKEGFKQVTDNTILKLY